MEEIVLQAENREITGKKVKALRREGKLPAIIYGLNMDPIPINLDMRETVKILSSTTASNLIKVEVNGEEVTTIVRDRQHDPVTSSLLHVDFLRVSMTEKIRTTVGIAFIGEAPAIKNYGGILVTRNEQLDIESYPQDLPDHIDVDLSNLTEIGDSILVRDLTIPENVSVLTHEDEMIVVVTAPSMEAEAEVVEELEEEEEPEVIERGKREFEDDDKSLE